MSKLYIHIGSHKTGTTSIQRACANYLPRETNPEVRFINVRRPKTKMVQSSGRLAEFRAGVDLETADRVLRPDRGGKASGLRRLNTSFIISDEDFFWISEPDTVHRLAAILKPRFSSIEVICYLRRQDLLAVSHRKQVSEGSGMPAARFYGVTATPLPKFQPHYLRYFDYAAKLADIWVGGFGKANVKVIPYERGELVNGDVVDDFAQRTGAQFAPPDPVRVNSSLTGDRTLVGLKLAELGAPVALRQKILSGLPGTGTFLPTRAEAQDFLAHFAAANGRLGREWSWADKPLIFSDDFDMYPETEAAQWSHENLERILHAVLSGALGADKTEPHEPHANDSVEMAELPQARPGQVAQPARS